MVEDVNLYIQEAEQTSNRINCKKSLPRHIIIKFVKTKDKEKKNLESSQRETTHYLERNNHLSIADFSSETMEAKREHNIFQELEKKKNKTLSAEKPVSRENFLQE